MCKYCKQISDETGLPEWQVNSIVDRFIKLREFDGIYSLEISSECEDLLFDDHSTGNEIADKEKVNVSR